MIKTSSFWRQWILTLICTVAYIWTCAGQYNFSDDFEAYESATNIQSLELWKSADQVLVSTAQSRSGNKSIKISSPNSSLVKLMTYDDFVSGILDFEFYIWKEKKASISISPNYAFPNLKFKANNYAVSYINKEGGYLEFEPERWHKVNFHINADLLYYDIRVDDLVVGRGMYQPVFRNILAINNYPGGDVYLDDFTVRNSFPPSPKVNLLISDYRLNQLNMEKVKDSLWVTVTQEGTQVVDGMEVRWNQNGSMHVVDLQSLTLNPGGSHNVFLGEVELNKGDNYFTIDIESKNSLESDYSDNRLELRAQGKYRGTKPVLLEYTTSTSHGYSPVTIVGADAMMKNFGSQVSVINMHGNDPMYSADYYFAGPFYLPRLYANRYEANVQPSLDERISLLQEDSSIDIDLKVNYDPSDNQLKCETEVVFLEAYENPIYHTVILVEDSVTGTSSYYDQANSFSGGIFGPFEGYENKPQYIPASEMVYRFVGRKAFNGTYGSKVFISVDRGESLTYHSSDPIDLEAITDKHYLVSVIFDQNRKVLNHKKVKIKEVMKILTGSKDEPLATFRLFPNPASRQLHVSEWEKAESIEIYTVNGDCILTAPSAPEIQIEHLANELYYLKIVDRNGKSYVLPFIKTN